MNAISYLLKKSLKNWILDLKRKPQFIILIIFVAFILFTSFLSRGNIAQNSAKFDILLVSSILLIVFLILGGLTINGGLSKTVNYFRLSDVNLMFTSPISPSTVIVYAMIKNIGSLVFVSLFLIYQTGTMVNALHMTVNYIIYTYIGFFFMLIMSLTTSILLMLSTSGRAKRRELYKKVLYLLIGALLVYGLFVFYNNSDKNLLEIFKLIASNPMLDYIPVLGWMRGFVIGLIAQDYSRVTLFAALSFILILVEIVFIANTKNDYYEDVLDGATLISNKLQAVKEGKTSYKTAFKEKKIKNAGIKNGKGASVLMYKRLVEKKRGAFGFLSFQNIVLIVAGLVMSTIGNETFIIYIAIIIYMNIIFQVTGSWESELTKHYIYLIPDHSYKKLIYAILPELIGSLINSGLIFIIGVSLFKLNPVVPFIAAVCFMSTSFLVSGTFIIIRRIFNADSKNTLVRLVAIFMPIIIIGIGLIPSGIIQFALNPNPQYPIAGAIILTIWNFVISILLVFLGKGVLTKGMNN